jgi:hypothetical protein
MVRLSYAKCGRAGQHRNQNLITQFGAEIPNVRYWHKADIARESTRRQLSDTHRRIRKDPGLGVRGL